MIANGTMFEIDIMIPSGRAAALTVVLGIALAAGFRATAIVNPGLGNGSGLVAVACGGKRA